MLPPLRRRGEDLQVLTDHFLAEFGQAQGREVALSDAARDRLSKHTWPGNVRQLRAVLRRAVLLSTPGQVIDSAELQLDSGSAPATLLEELKRPRSLVSSMRWLSHVARGPKPPGRWACPEPR